MLDLPLDAVALSDTQDPAVDKQQPYFLTTSNLNVVAQSTQSDNDYFTSVIDSYLSAAE